jgi:hypothetical protein
LQNNTFRTQSDVNLSPILAAKMCGEMGVKCHLFLPFELGEKGRWKAGKFEGSMMHICLFYIHGGSNMTGTDLCVNKPPTTSLF